MNVAKTQEKVMCDRPGLLSPKKDALVVLLQRLDRNFGNADFGHLTRNVALNFQDLCRYV